MEDNVPLDNPQPSSPKTHQYGGKMGTYGHITTCLNVAGIWDVLELQLELIPEAELKFQISWCARCLTIHQGQLYTCKGAKNDMHIHTWHASQPWHALANHTKLLERDLWQGPPSDLLGHLLLPSSAWWKWWTVLWRWIKRYYRFQTSLKIVVIHLGRIYCSTQCFLFLFWAKFLEWTLCHLTVCTGVLEACGTIWCWTIHD